MNAEAKWGLSTQCKMIQSQKGNSETHCNLGKLESIMLNEINQSQKEESSVTSHTGDPQSGQIHSTRAGWWVPGTESRSGGWGAGITGHSISLGKQESGGACTVWMSFDELSSTELE